MLFEPGAVLPMHSNAELGAPAWRKLSE
jgi:hypothetical protein